MWPNTLNDVHISGVWDSIHTSLCKKIPVLNFKPPVVQWVQDEPQCCPRHRGACCALPGSGAGPFEPGVFYCLIVQTATASLHGDVTAFQTADKWVSCCSRWAASWRLFVMAGWRAQTTARRRDCVDMSAQPNTYTGHAVHFCPFREVCFRWLWGQQSVQMFVGFSHAKQHFLKMLETRLLAHIDHIW